MQWVSEAKIWLSQEHKKRKRAKTINKWKNRWLEFKRKIFVKDIIHLIYEIAMIILISTKVIGYGREYFERKVDRKEGSTPG